MKSWWFGGETFKGRFGAEPSATPREIAADAHGGAETFEQPDIGDAEVELPDDWDGQSGGIEKKLTA